MKGLVQSNIDALWQSANVVRTLDATTYRSSILPGAASIGAHIRHNLDHYLCFLRGLERGSIDYAARDRDASVECAIMPALAQIEQVTSRLRRLSVEDRPVSVIGRDGTAHSYLCSSSLLRELDFLLNHTIHHHAIIGLICAAAGVTVRTDFGVSPSTLRHRRATVQRNVCAR